MAINFNANQFDKEYGPRRLRNWELPQRPPERPGLHRVPTRIIANDRGHLLPGVPRPIDNPWGRFVSTWKLPRRITRNYVDELHSKYTSKSKRRNECAVNNVNKEQTNAKDEATEEDTGQSAEPEPNPNETSLEKDLSYTPGDLTEPHHRPPSYQLLRKQKSEEEKLEEIRKSDMEDSRSHSVKTCKGHKKMFTPFACTYRNFEMAKRCAKENLEHHPLPDTVTDAMFRKLQLEGVKNPGLALKDVGQAAGIAWKGYGAVGPTQCTKMRIFRPKTTLPKKINVEDPTRPGSCGTFDMKWRFIKQKHVSPIDLAICWDMRPEDPNDEPKRTPHIDGSNGSAAPAVFAMVHSPKQPEEEPSRKSSISKQSCDGIHGCGTIKSSDSASVASNRPKTAYAKNGDLKPKLLDTNNNLKKHSASSNSLYVNHNLTRKNSEQSVCSQESKGNLAAGRKLHQSSPNLSSASSECKECSGKRRKPFARPCLACVNKNDGTDNELKSEYKMAFKAGKFVNKSLDGSEESNSSAKASVKVPKQRDPYAKRNYDINSLTPPFSVWRGTSYPSYPEHWRLASVYQHSYKPVEARKRSLLASVFQ